MISDKYINGQAFIDRIEAKEINKENCQLNEVEKSELDRRCMGIQVYWNGRSIERAKEEEKWA